MFIGIRKAIKSSVSLLRARSWVGTKPLFLDGSAVCTMLLTTVQRCRLHITLSIIRFSLLGDPTIIIHIIRSCKGFPIPEFIWTAREASMICGDDLLYGPLGGGPRPGPARPPTHHYKPLPARLGMCTAASHCQQFKTFLFCCFNRNWLV